MSGSTGAELDVQLQEAARLSDAGRDEEAFALLLDAEADHPRDPTLLCLLGALAGQVGADGVASDFFRRCLDEEPIDPRILVTAGAGLARSGDPAAEPALRLAALTAPELPLARLQYGAYLARSGLTEDALRELEAARVLTPDDPVVLRELASALILADRLPAALDALEAAVDSAETSEMRVFFALALLHAREGERAAEELHRASGETDEAEVHLLTSLACAAQEWDDEAWLALSRAEGAPDAPDAATLREIEEALEAGPDAANELLSEQLAPSALRDRLFLS
jgi:Flp pilus assembly protein TadD